MQSRIIRKFAMAATLAAAIDALTIVASASAADMTVKAPAPVANGWTGFYVGVNAGGAAGRISDVLSIANGSYFAPGIDPGVAASGSSSLNTNGLTGGIQAGYNWQFGQLVYGIEADFNALRQGASYGGRFLYPNLAPYNLTVSRSTDWLATFRPRVGVVTGHALLYVTGGLALTNFKFNQVFSEPPDSQNASIAQLKAGWTVGAGSEAQLSGNWTVKAEYLFVQFDVGSAAGSLPGAVLSNSLDKLDEHIGRVGLNYKFGGPLVARY